MNQENNLTKDNTLQIPKEEVFNAMTHGFGALLAFAGLIVILVINQGEYLFSLLTYGITLILLYMASTLYHSVRNPEIKKLLRKVDHMAIFVLIAGTYTPFCTIALTAESGLPLLVIVWSLAGAGIAVKIFFTGKFEFLSLVLYIAMGWVALIAIKPIYQSLPMSAFLLLMLGGVCYTGGIIFYVSKARYHHGIWHLFVLGGSIFHFFSVISLT